MRKLFLSSVVGIFSVIGAAQAADMPSYPVEHTAVGHDWSGWYVGINGGWNWGDADEDAAAVDFDDLEGFVIGGHVGYNWQMDSGLVFGLEADGNYTDNEADGADDIEQNYLASFRGRLGFGFDNFLVYGTGGIGFTGADVDVIGAPGDDADYFGFVVGGGVEYMLTENVTLGVEYLHYEFDDEAFADDGAGAGADFDLGLNNDVVRGRLSVKFDSLFN